MPKTPFGLACQDLLNEFIKVKNTSHPYQCIEHCQYRISDLAFDYVPQTYFPTIPSDERFIVAIQDEGWNQSCDIILRYRSKNGTFRLPAWSDEGTRTPDATTIDEIILCLRGWIEWDEKPKDQLRTNHSAIVNSNNADPLLVTKCDLDKLLVSIKTETIMKDKKTIDWPTAIHKPKGKPHAWDYIAVRKAIENCSRSDKNVLLGKLPESPAEVRAILASVPKAGVSNRNT